MPRDDWRRLAQYVRARRNVLGWPTAKLFAQDARLTPQTVSALENGKRVRPNTLNRVEIMLRWKPGSAQTILEGGEPEQSTKRIRTDLRDDVEHQLWDLDLPESERDALIALHRGMTDRDDAEGRRRGGQAS